MRLIDFNCDNCIHRNVCHSYMVTKPDCKEYLPIGNVVPVVRCKDCKFRKSTFSGEDYFCTVLDADESETAYVTDSDFCSYGERKEGAE